MSVRREPFRGGRRVVRRIVLSILVVAILAAGADFGLRLWAQSWLERRLQEAVATSAAPDVELEGFPFLVQFVRGRLTRVEATLHGVDTGGLFARSISLDLRDVDVGRGSLLTRGSGRIRVETGSAQLEVGEEAMSAFLQRRGYPVEVAFPGPRIRVSTELEIAGHSGTASATGPLRLEEGRLVFEPERIDLEGGISAPVGLLSFSVRVPRPFPGLRYDRVVIEGGVARLLMTLHDAELRVPPSP